MVPSEITPEASGAIRSSRVWTTLVLLGLAGFITASRLHWYDEPLERDLTTYAVFGHEILEGRSLYTDLWNNYPPTIFLTYAASELVVGFGPIQVFALGLAAALVTMLGVWNAASVLGGRAAGLWAAAFWAVCCGDLGIEANQPNTEAFINALMAWVFALFARLDSSSSGLARTLAIGILSALATAYKPVVVFIPAALGLAHLLSARLEPGGRIAVALRQVLIIGVIGAAFWSGVFLYFQAIGHLNNFLEAVVYYNRHYSGNFLDNLGTSFRARRGRRMLFTIPLFLLSATALLLGPRPSRAPNDALPDRSPLRHAILLIFYFLSIHLSITFTGQFQRHYYQLWLPGVAIGAGWAVSLLWREGNGMVRTASRFVGPATLVLLLAYELPNFRFSPEEASRKKYEEVFVSSDRLGRRLGEVLARDESLYQCGDELGLYFSSRHRPPVNPIWWYHLRDSPYSARLAPQVLEQLRLARPEVIVVRTQVKQEYPGKYTEFFQWIDSSYALAPGLAIDDVFEVYVLRGGSLEARLNGNSSKLGRQ